MVVVSAVLVTASAVYFRLWRLWCCVFADAADCLVFASPWEGWLCAAAGWAVDLVAVSAVDASVVSFVLVIAPAVERCWAV